MRQYRRVEVVLLMVLGGEGCGGGGGATLHLEDAAVCKSAWQPLTAPKPFDELSALVYQAGTLYYSSLNAQALLSVPVDGTTPTALAPVVSRELWLEGDHLLFTGGPLANQIFSLPLAGGTTQLVLDGGTGRTAAGIAMVHAYTAADFYWIEESIMDAGLNDATVWHQARSGGTPVQIGTTSFTDPGGFDFPGTAIALSGDVVVVGSAFGQAATFPTGGGAAAPLTTPTASSEMNVESSLSGLGGQWVQGPFSPSAKRR